MLVRINQNPFTEIDRVFNSVLRTGFPALVDESPLNFGFKVDIAEDEKAIHLEAELPGFKKEDVKIGIDNYILTIRADRKQESEESKKNYFRTERVYGSFVRSFTLGENINHEQINAEYKDGVLHLELPKMEVVKTVKEISIK